MKKKIMSLALLLMGLVACNNEEVISTGGEYVPDGYAGITFKMATTKDASSRATGDTLKNTLTKQEKEIRSIAFFVQTEDGFNKFFSTEPDKSLNGLYQPLTKAGNVDGEYTAQLRIKGDKFGASEIVVIANYAENGLDASLKALTAMDDLKKELVTITDNAMNPLLMYCAKNVTLTSGQTLPESFEMTRMVARIDILNNASDNGFVLQSARLVNAKTQAYLCPLNDNTKLEKLPVKTLSVRNVEADQKKIDTLYTYENPNTVDATALELVGTFKGAPTVKLVKFEQLNADNKYQTIAIQRNYRYLVEVNPGKGDQDVNLTIKVKDWAAADTFYTEAPKEKPILTTIVTNGLSGITRSGKEFTVDGDPTTMSGTVTFTAKGHSDTNYELKYIGRKNAAWMGSAVERGELIGFYASDTLSRQYTIDFSKVNKLEFATTPNNTVPSDVLVIVRNEIAPTACDTIMIIKFRPDYDGIAGMKPVLYNGQFWAPVNCGATKVPTVITTTWSLETYGYLYQWGRKVPFSYGVTSDNYTPGAEGYPTYIEATTAGYANANKFIIGNSVADYSWFKDYKGETLSSALTVGDKAWPRENQPCPAGWCIPTKEEFTPIMTEANGSNKLVNSIWKNGDLTLYAVGFRSHDGSDGLSSRGRYWTSALSASGTPLRLGLYGSGANIGPDNLANAFSVRCIQE